MLLHLWRLIVARNRTQATKSRVGVKVEELTPEDTLVEVNVHSTNTASETPFTTSCSTNTPETCGELFLSPYDVGQTKLRPGISFGSGQLDLATDEPHHIEPQHAEMQQALIETVPPPPPLKPTWAPRTQSLPTPTSQLTLYDNLRFSLSLKPLPRFPVLVDYHDSYPEFRSTKSYNFLIELSIRHAQFGITNWLFDAMNRDKIRRDSMTRKLSLRWFVRTGRWEHAWMQATASTPDEVLYKPLRNGLPPNIIRIPWYHWVELLFTCKRGALRRTRNYRWDINEEGNPERLPTLEIIKDPSPGTEAYTRRRRLLACLQPMLKYNATWKTLRTNLIRGAIYALLRDGRASEAAELVKMYFLMLPLEVSDETVAQCMSIIHLLLSADTGNGLTSMFAKRRLLLSLIKIHPSLKPTSTSLFQILAPLRGAKKSGTVAFKVMKAFQKSWGKEMVDTRVRRRVGSLAQKEGRMDIVQTLLDEESQAQKATKSAFFTTVGPWTAQLSGMRGLRRLSDRTLFPRKGLQTILWTQFKLRARRKLRLNNRIGSDTLE